MKHTGKLPRICGICPNTTKEIAMAFAQSIQFNLFCMLIGLVIFLPFIANVIILFTIKNKIADYLALFNDLYIIIAAHPFGMRCS
jgi:hypothetical protein